MIIDSLENISNYEGLNPFLPKAIEFIQSLDMNDLEIGKIEVDGKNVFAMISDSKLKTPEQALLEVHNNYLDIQIPVSKAEGFGWKERTSLQHQAGDFDTTKDIQFYDDKPTVRFDLMPGNFVIFFPQDAHAPCVGEGSVVKIVIKVKMNS